MVFKRNRNQEVIANENKLTELEAAFIKKIADDGFEYLKDDYEDRNEMHLFNSYMSTFQRLEQNDPVMAVALIDLLLHEHGYEYISEYMRVVADNGIEPTLKLAESIGNNMRAYFLELFCAEDDDEYEDYEYDEYEDDCFDDCECERGCTGDCDECELFDKGSFCDIEPIHFTIRVGNQIVEGTVTDADEGDEMNE